MSHSDKIRDIFIVLLIGGVLQISAVAYAGGAMAAMQQKKKQQEQIIQHQIIMQQQAVIQEKVDQQRQQNEQIISSHSDETAEEVVDIRQLWKSLEGSSKAWPLIIDERVKVLTVAKFIEFYRQKGIAIKKPPAQYMVIIDQMVQESPNMLDSPFERVLMIAAIVEYDFDNGQDKDKMALQILGQSGFWANKQRLGLK